MLAVFITISRGTLGQTAEHTLEQLCLIIMGIFAAVEGSKGQGHIILRGSLSDCNTEVYTSINFSFPVLQGETYTEQIGCFIEIVS